mgnify:CR=1 FL=1
MVAEPHEARERSGAGLRLERRPRLFKGAGDPGQRNRGPADARRAKIRKHEAGAAQAARARVRRDRGFQRVAPRFEEGDARGLGAHARRGPLGPLAR